MAKNRTHETKQQNRTATDQTNGMTEARNDKTTENRGGTTHEKATVQAAREKAKEEEEKLSGLWEIRARFKNLAENILPKHPYLIGIPSKIHITRNEGPDWRRGTPFSPHEERVQYVSFQRLDDDETVLRSQSWDEENAKSSQSGSTRRTSSDISSLPGQTPRKKMSMEEYFRKKNPGSASENASREGSIAPRKTEVKPILDGNTGTKAKPKTSPSEGTVSKMEGKVIQGATLATKTQATLAVPATGKGVSEEKNGALDRDASTRKETTTRKEVTARENLSVQREIATHQTNAKPKEAHTEKVIAKEKEVLPTREGTLHGKKRPIEAVASATDLNVSSGLHVVPPSKKARISPTASALGEVSPPKPTNAHGFPPLLSPTLPPSIEEELAYLQTQVNDVIDSIADLGDMSDERTIPSGKGLAKPDATSQDISNITIPISISVPAPPKQPGSNGLNSKIVEAAQNSMFFGQPRRTLQPKKLEATPPPRQSAKKTELISKAEENRLKVAELADAKGQPKGNAKKSDLPAKPVIPSKINEHANAKRLSKDVGNDLKAPVMTTSGPKSVPEHLVKKSLIVILKIPRSKRKACQALLRFSPRPRKPNGLQPTPTTVSKEHYIKAEVQTNAIEKQVETNQTVQKRPTAPATPPRQEVSLVKTTNRGQHRPAPAENEDPEPSKKRLKPSDDGNNLASKTFHPAMKDDAEPAGKHPRPPKDYHDRAEKRLRPAEKEDLEPSKKRPRLCDDVNPVQPGPKPSNILQPQAAAKSHTFNPKSDVKSATMRRIASLDGEVKTPSATLREGTPSGPGSAERANREGRPTSSTASAASAEEAALWRVEEQKYLELGKHLKHELDGIVKKDGVLMKDPIANKKGCPIGVESILCYMLGFTALDERGRARGRPGTSTAWETLLPHIDYVKAITSSASHIYGLILQLEGMCRNTIHSYDLERLEREQGAAASEFIGRLLENARLAHKVWLAGTTGLSINDLQKSFPKTWAKRVSAPPARNGAEKLVPGKFAARGYYLPLASTSAAVEAAVMGWSFLAEWAEMEGVEWKGRMF